MAHNERIRADDAAWFANSAVAGAEFAKLDRQLFGSLNADTGGVWSPTAVIDLLGSFGLSADKLAGYILYASAIRPISNATLMQLPLIKDEGGRILENHAVDTLHNQHKTAGFARTAPDYDGTTQELTADYVNFTVLYLLATGTEQSVRLLNANCITGDVITVRNDLPTVEEPGNAPVSLLVKNDAGATIISLGRNQWADFMFNGTSWCVLRNAGF